MVLQSGVLPYEYAHGGRRFEAKPIPIGLSGILLEQAQFIITAEMRKWRGEWHRLPDFNVYVNTNIAPSGPYEPKALGTTLDNFVNPGASIFIDNIAECRAALNTLLSFYSSDTDSVGTLDYRRGWLRSLFPESPSGFITAIDDQLNTSVRGLWRHRLPSAIGVIDYCSDEVLGSSGVMYDIDFAEVMFNPAPHIGAMGFDEMHGRNVGGSTDSLPIQQYPLFPAFQKTNGSLIPLTGREPTVLSNVPGFNALHVTSGCVRLNGYMLKPLTQFYLSRETIFDNTPDFSFFSEGIRAPFSPNVPTTVAFIVPTAQNSGVYRIGARNRFSDYPNGTIESGAFSHWPQPGFYWPADFPTNSTTTRANSGYHIFDDCLWMTDRSSDASKAGPVFSYPSGLAVVSPFTGHRMWIRYAEMVPTTVTTFLLTDVKYDWSTQIGLERVAPNSIYRTMPSIQRPLGNPTSGQMKFARYNDMLDFGTEVTTTSLYFSGNNLIPLGGDTGDVSDMWYDGTYYWVFNDNAVGVDAWKFDTSFNYVTKYIFNRPSGINGARGAFVNGKNVLYYGFLNGGLASFSSSGIFPMNIITDGTDPFDNTGNAPQVGEIDISFATAKYIDGQTLIGAVISAEIMDLFEVTSSTHTIPGVYCVVRFRFSGLNGGTIYLLRIEETSTAWEIRAHTKLEAGVNINAVRRELLHMDY